MHRVRLNGTDNQIVAEKASWPIVCGEYVYYGSWMDESWSVRRVNRDGSKDVLVGKDMYTYTIHDGKIYYNTASYPHKTMMCDLNGKHKKEVTSGNADFVILPESSRILMTFDGNECMIMNLNGTDLKQLF